MVWWCGVKGSGEATHATKDVIVLRILVELALGISTVNHAAAHGDGGLHDRLEDFRSSGLAQGVDATLRQRQVDGLCEVEGDAGSIAQV